MAKTSESTNKNFVERELNGASFMSLEHLGHLALVVIVPILVVCAMTMALAMWFGVGDLPVVLDVPSVMSWGVQTPLNALCLAAALVVLIPVMLLLERRTRAEWQKRPAFTRRLAYKLPVYGALAATTAIVLWFKIQLLYVLISTVALIGVVQAPFALLYSQVFLPAFLGLLVFTPVWWYAFKLAKGQDYGRVVNVAVAIVGLALAGALFVTAAIKMHEPSTSIREVPVPSQYPSRLEKFYQ